LLGLRGKRVIEKKKPLFGRLAYESEVTVKICGEIRDKERKNDSIPMLQAENIKIRKKA
jgi:hypothetical protein